MKGEKSEAVVIRMHTRKYNDPEYWFARAEDYRAQSSDYHDPETRRMMMNMARQAEMLGQRISEDDVNKRHFVAIRYSSDDIAALILKDAMRRLGDRSLRLESDESGGFVVRTSNE